MIIKRMLKFALPAMLLAVSAPAYADGEAGTTEPNEPTEPKVVKLKNGNTTTWSDFVKTLNGNTTVTGTVSVADQKAWDDAVEAYGKLEQGVEEAKANVSTAKTEYDKANANVTQWSAELNMANANLSAKKDERDEKNAEIAKLETQLKEAYDDKIAANNVTIAENDKTIAANEKEIIILQGYMDALMVPEKITAPWLTTARNNADVFANAFKNKPATDAPDITVYYNAYMDEDEEVNALKISFVSHDTWEPMGAKQLYQKLKIKFGSAASTIGIIEVYLGEGQTYSSTGMLPVLGTILSSVGSNVQTTIKSIPTADYQVDGEETTNSNPALYKQYEDQKTALEEQNRILGISNNELSAENDRLLTAKATDDRTKDLATAKTDLETIKGEIEALNNTILALNNNLIPFISATTEVDTLTGELYKDEDGKVLTGLQVLLEKLHRAEAAQKDAEDLLAAGKAVYDAAKAAYEAAVAKAQADALENYKDITLTADIETSTPITKIFEGTIIGQKADGSACVINYTGEGQLFSTYSGSLGKIAVNGQFANISSGARNNVATWDGTSGNYWDADGNKTSEINSIGALGYKARNIVGVDFDNKKLVAVAEGTKVYDVTVYTPGNTQQYFAVKNGNALKSENAGAVVTVTIPTNMFAESKTSDLKLDNVFYKDGDKYVCETVNIEDRVGFYAPVEIQATTVNYARIFKAGDNAVCLPFELKDEYFTEKPEFFAYWGESEDAFYFKRDLFETCANAPVLVVLPKEANEVSLTNLENITIKQTPDSQLVEDDGNREDASKAIGLFKDVLPASIDPQYTYSVYAVSGGTFKAVNPSTQTNIPAFRMVLLSNLAKTGEAAGSAPRRIALLNEDGKEINDPAGVNSVAADNNSSLSVVAGQGQLTINSEADYGEVAIYSIDGKVAATANVMAGTTTVNLQTGVYIVLGKKVMVK